MERASAILVSMSFSGGFTVFAAWAMAFVSPRLMFMARFIMFLKVSLYSLYSSFLAMLSIISLGSVSPRDSVYMWVMARTSFMFSCPGPAVFLVSRIMVVEAVMVAVAIAAV